MKQPHMNSSQRKPVSAAHPPVARSHGLSTISTGSAMLGRQPGCACGGGCPRCQEQALVQTKLKISKPGDKHKQKVDSMYYPDEASETEPLDASPGEEVQRRATGKVGAVSPQFEQSLQQAIDSGGEALPAPTQSFMENRFGRDFSSVRVYSDAQANTLAQGVNARAFSLGDNIFFARSQYQPESLDGQRLLAHELTHVIQQSEGRLSRQIQLQPQQRSQPLQLPQIQTTQVNFHDPNFCYRPGSPRDSTHPDLSRVVAVMQAQIVQPRTCDDTFVLRTSVLRSHWGAASAQFESFGAGVSQGLYESIHRDLDGERVDYEEHFRLDNCQAYFDRCHLIVYYEGGTKYTFAQAGYRPRIFAMSASSGIVLHDATPAPGLIVDPCDHVTPTYCGGSSGTTGASMRGATSTPAQIPSSSTSTAKSKR